MSTLEKSYFIIQNFTNQMEFQKLKKITEKKKKKKKKGDYIITTKFLRLFILL